jgi:hypothetical protein
MAVNTTLRFHAGIVDANNIRTTVLSHLLVDDGQTLAATNTALQAWLTALTGIVDAKIVTASAGIYASVGASQAGKPAAGSEVQETGLWSFDLASTPFRYGQAVPGLADSVLIGTQIDPTNAAVIAWEALLLGAVLGGHYTGTNSDALASVYKTLYSTRSRRKQLTAKSTTIR